MALGLYKIPLSANQHHPALQAAAQEKYKLLQALQAAQEH